MGIGHQRLAFIDKSALNPRPFSESEPAHVRHGDCHIAEGLIWASLWAVVLKRFLAHAHAAQRVR